MAEYVIREETLVEIADAIRARRGASIMSEYTQVEYIQSDGLQYIDTGYRATTENIMIMADFMLIEIQGWHALWGCESTNSGPWLLTPLVNGASALTFYSGDSSQIGSVPVSANVEYTLTCQTNSGHVTYECGTINDEAYATGSVCSTDNLYIFTINSAKDDAILTQSVKMRLYSFKMYDDGILVRDFVPCIRADGATGLYDAVNGEFYSNLGSGSFSTGASIGAIEQPGSGTTEVIPVVNMAAEIRAIPHKLPDGVHYLASGSFVLDSEVSSYYGINCGLEFDPNFYYIYVQNGSIEYGVDANMVMCVNAQVMTQPDQVTVGDDFEAFAAYTKTDDNGAVSRYDTYGPASLFFANGYIYVVASPYCKLKAGVTYYWIAGKIDGLG